MKKLTAIIACASIAFAVNKTHAEPGMLRERGRELVRTIAMDLLDFRSKAGITDEQKSQIKEIVQSHKPEIVAQLQKGKDARRAMQAAVEATGPESTEALKAADGVADAARSRALLTAKVMSEIRPVLTPEQLSLAKSTRDQIEAVVDACFSGLAE